MFRHGRRFLKEGISYCSMADRWFSDSGHSCFIVSKSMNLKITDYYNKEF